MQYSFDIHEIYSTISENPATLATLSCRPSTNYAEDSSSFLSCVHMASSSGASTIAINTPIELLYILYTAIKKHINTNIITKFDANKLDTAITLAANYSPTCPQTITEIDTYKSNVDSLFASLSEFLNKLATSKITTAADEKALTGRLTISDALNAVLKEVLNCIENIDARAGLISIGNATRQNSAIMNPCVLLSEIDSFIEYLDSLYMFQINLVLMKNKVVTEINGNLHRPTTSACGYAPKGYKFLLLVQQQKVKSAICNELVQTGKTIFYKNTSNGYVIDFDDGLSRFCTFPASSQKMLADNNINTNGKFDSTTEIKPEKNFNKDLIKEKYKNTANLEQGKIASRNDILYAIYDIFYYWLNNVNKVYINVNICHGNCHANSYKIVKYRNNGKDIIVQAGNVHGQSNFGIL